MANKKAHMVAGALAGGALYVIKTLRTPEDKRQWSLVEGLAYAGGGAIIGLLPDILEPALHPNHRSVFHSVAGAAALGIVCHNIISSPKTEPALKSIAALLLVSYGSHLVLDAKTPKGLPLLKSGC